MSFKPVKYYCKKTEGIFGIACEKDDPARDGFGVGVPYEYGMVVVCVKDEAGATAIFDLLTEAYEAGRKDLQKDLRKLIGAEAADKSMRD